MNSSQDSPAKNLVTSFLSLVLIGSLISSMLLLGLTVFPQQVWAAVPAAPSVNFPADLLTTEDTKPAFNWNRITGGNAATGGYKIQIDNSGSSFPSPEVDQTVAQPGSGGSVSFTAPTLALGTYTWRVQGINADGSGPFTTRTITIALKAPVLVSPAAGSTTTDQTPTFTWNRETGGQFISNSGG